MLEMGIGIIHHVGARKKAEALHDKMISPITDAFNNYDIHTDLYEFLVNPLIEGLNKIKNESKCSFVFDKIMILLKKLSKNKNFGNKH
jgi:hypothetical protein